MRDVSVVGFGPEQTKTVLAVTKTHAHMTRWSDDHCAFEGVCVMYEVKVSLILVRGCSACDIGQWASGERRRKPRPDGKASL